MVCYEFLIQKMKRKVRRKLLVENSIRLKHQRKRKEEGKSVKHYGRYNHDVCRLLDFSVISN